MNWDYIATILLLYCYLIAALLVFYEVNMQQDSNVDATW